MRPLVAPVPVPGRGGDALRPARRDYRRHRGPARDAGAPHDGGGGAGGRAHPDIRPRRARASWSLPDNASVSGTLDWLRFGGSEGAQFYTRLASVSARKDLGRHGLRAEWRELRAAPQPVPARSLEIEDAWRPLPGVSLGGLLRWRTSAGAGGEARALDVRAFGSFSRGRWSAYASAERGRDVADDTLLARRLYSSSQFGLTGAIGGWKLSVRGGRFTRAQQLTPGAAADSLGPAWAPVAPLVGSISGRVWTGTAEAAVPIEGVWVLVGDRGMRLDQVVLRLEPGGRWTAARRDGTWAFRGLPSGDYAVEIDRTRPDLALGPRGARRAGARGGTRGHRVRGLRTAVTRSHESGADNLAGPKAAGESRAGPGTETLTRREN